MKSKLQKINRILEILYAFDAKKQKNIDLMQIRENVAMCVEKKKPLILIQFTCSTINAKYLFDKKNPERYVALNPRGNNLEPDLRRLESLYTSLVKETAVKLIIIIGNTDPFYIYTQEGKTCPSLSKAILLKRFNQRWTQYRKNLQAWIKNTYPLLNCTVVSWYQFEQDMKLKTKRSFYNEFRITLPKIQTLFTKSEFQWELNQLEKAFGNGKYFVNLSKPKTQTLKIWIRRKFTEYALQGLWILEKYPTAILLQNEKPSDLRTKMYQPLIIKKLHTRLAALYPYGVDNEGYQ